jgi:hypothetical protein
VMAGTGVRVGSSTRAGDKLVAGAGVKAVAGVEVMAGVWIVAGVRVGSVVVTKEEDKALLTSSGSILRSIFEVEKGIEDTLDSVGDSVVE